MDDQEVLTQETEGNKVWISLDDLEPYLRGFATALMNMVGNIDATLATMKQQQEGDTNDDNKD